jgi:predicted RNase H-like HicB family nuclease
VPDIQGCVSQGDSFEETVKCITEAIGLCIEVALEHGEKPPVPSAPENVKIEKDQFVSVIEFDLVEYQKKYGTKAVKKTLTIPAWLNTISEREHINFSAVLQDALVEKLHLNNV